MKFLIFLLLLILIVGPVGLAKSGLQSANDQNIAIEPQVVDLTIVSPAGPPPVQVAVQGAVTDLQRFQLALNAGWSLTEAVTATAISIAENGSGIPTLSSGKNRDGSFDYCLWQINSSWFNQFPQVWLSDPQNCADAAHFIYMHGGWNRWCTYPGGCGGGPGASNWPQALARALAVAKGSG